MIETIFGNIYVAIVIVALFGATIFIHELGHYLLGRMLGLVVEVFSIGFGHSIWKKKINGITYKIGWIPLGGYVSLPQLDPAAMESIQGKKDEKAGDDKSFGEDASKDSTEDDEKNKYADLPPIPAWKKIIVAAAGATFNIILAIALAWVVYLVGVPATVLNQPAVAGYVYSESDVYQQGLRSGDTIKSVNGRSVDGWASIIQEFVNGENVEIVAAHPDGEEFTVSTQTKVVNKQGLRLVMGLDSVHAVIAGEIMPNSPAERAGIISGDHIINFNGTDILSFMHLVDLVSQSAEKESVLLLERDIDGETKEISLNITPALGEDQHGKRVGRIGMTNFVDENTSVNNNVKIHQKPMAQIKQHFTAVFRMLGDLINPKTAKTVGKQVGGPVAIISGYVSMVKQSFMLALWFTVLLNVNLAIINMLPIPVLDGGHIVFSTWEAITGKPVHPKLVNLLVNICALLLIALFLFLTYRDTERSSVGTAVKNFFKDGDTATNELVTVSGAVGNNGVDAASQYSNEVEKARNEVVTPLEESDDTVVAPE